MTHCLSELYISLWATRTCRRHQRQLGLISSLELVDLSFVETVYLLFFNPNIYLIRTFTSFYCYFSCNINSKKNVYIYLYKSLNAFGFNIFGFDIKHLNFLLNKYRATIIIHIFIFIQNAICKKLDFIPI